MCDNGSKEIKDDCTYNHPSVSTVDNRESSFQKRSSDVMTELQKRRAASTHHSASNVKSWRAGQAAPEQPRASKKGVSSSRLPSSRYRPAARNPSHTELAFQQTSETPVGIPHCWLERHLRSLMPVSGSDDVEGVADGHGNLTLDSVNRLPFARPQSYIQSKTFDLQDVKGRINSKSLLQRTTDKHSASSTLLLRSSDTNENFADIVYNHYVLITDDCLTQEMQWEVEALEDPKPKAPVTKANLKELDLQSIQNTISLRYDLCFDQGLLFQRVSGVKGSEKKIKAQIFYRYVALELQAINHDLQGPCVVCQKIDSPRVSMQSRLTCYFRSLHDLLEMLVPESEKSSIEESIDAEWLTTRVRTGSFDAVTFSAWLHALLVRHCAPMRDSMAKGMQEKLSRGAVHGDMDLLAHGMEVLLCLCENMKIDIANHQIRTFKFLLIADTVPFLKDCFVKLRDSNQIDLRTSKSWFQDACRTARKNSPKQSNFACFIHGFIRLLCTGDDRFILPTMFCYGEDRIHLLRNEILDYIHLKICLDAYKARLRDTDSGYSEERLVRHRLVQLMSTPDGVSEGVRQHIQEIDLEITRAAFQPDKLRIARHSDAPDICSKAKSTSSWPPKDLEYFLDEKEEVELDSLAEKLLEPVLRFSKLFQTKDTLQISNYQRHNQEKAGSVSSADPIETDFKDISSKLAHIGVIHWQIWAELAHLDEDDCTTTPDELNAHNDIPLQAGGQLPHRPMHAPIPPVNIESTPHRDS